MAKWLEKLESFIGGGPGGPKRVRTLRWLLLLGCLGIGLLILNSFITLKQVEPSPETGDPGNDAPEARDTFSGRSVGGDSPFEDIERPLESRIKDILEKIVGVGTVDVLVTIDSTEEIVAMKNDKNSRQITDENDKNGGHRHISSVTDEGQVVLYEVSGDQTPLVVKKIKPRVRGILIVAKGAENKTVRELITDAVQKGVNVPSHRISVAPRKQP